MDLSHTPLRYCMLGLSVSGFDSGIVPDFALVLVIDSALATEIVFVSANAAVNSHVHMLLLHIQLHSANKFLAMP